MVIWLFQNNRLIVDKANEIITNRRRTYLVRSPSGLFWVILSRLSLNRIRISVFMVEEREPGKTPSLDPPAMAYRITRAALNGRFRSVKTQFINWSSVLLCKSGDDVHAFDSNTLNIRLQQIRRIQVEWFSWNRSTNSQSSNRYIQSAATDV